MTTPKKRYTTSTTIDAPPDRIWDLLTNAEAWPSWNTTILSIEGPIVVGEKVKLRVKLNPKRTFALTVVEMSPPTKMIWADGMPFGLFTGTRTYTIEPADDATVFEMTEVYTGLLSSLICRTIPDMTEAFDEFAAGLRSAAESS